MDPARKERGVRRALEKGSAGPRSAVPHPAGNGEAVKTIIEHDDDCPLGRNGLRAYWEARDALKDLPPEARATGKDREAIAQAEFELECRQACTCGAEK